MFSIIIIIVTLDQKRAIKIVETQLTKIQLERLPSGVLIVENPLCLMNNNPVPKSVDLRARLGLVAGGDGVQVTRARKNEERVRFRGDIFSIKLLACKVKLVHCSHHFRWLLHVLRRILLRWKLLRRVLLWRILLWWILLRRVLLWWILLWWVLLWRILLWWLQHIWWLKCLRWVLLRRIT